MSRLNSIESAVKNVKNRHKEKFKYFFSGWYGWEKWFQVELAYELSKNGEAYVEKSFPYSKAKKVPSNRLGNSNAFIDIIYRKNKDLKNFYSAVEVTLGRSPQKLKKAHSDLLRIKALKNVDWSFRSVYVILIFDKNHDGNNNYIKLFNMIKNNHINRCITAGDFEFLIFGWDSNGRVSNINNISYGEWLDELTQIYKECGVITAKAKRPTPQSRILK